MGFFILSFTFFHILFGRFFSLFSLDFYFPFFFGLLFFLFSLDFYFPFLFGLLFNRGHSSWVLPSCFLSAHLFVPTSIWTFVSLFSLDFYSPFFFALLFYLFSLDFYSIAVTHLGFFQVFLSFSNLLFPILIWTFISLFYLEVSIQFKSHFFLGIYIPYYLISV